MDADGIALARVAESVADGRPVDWNQAEEAARGAERRYLQHLRLVESIATLHRTLSQDDGQESQTQPGPYGVTWGGLVLRERIGQGTSGEVYRAWDPSLQRDVALKLFPSAVGSGRLVRTRGVEEARRLARIRHQHVAHVYGAEDHDGRVGFWMELVRGESLDTIVRERGPLGAREAALIGLDLCSALAAVHAAGLLHRDVKAQNVLRETGGRIVLTDFGTGEELRAHTGSRQLAGTPLYLAPEVLRGEAATVASDLYSLGVLLFYLVTGTFPCTGASVEDLVAAHAAGSRRRLRDLRPDVPRAFVQVVERALEPVPPARFESAGAMESALRDALQLPEGTQPAVTTVTPSARRRPWVIPVAAAIALAVVAVAVAVWWQGQTTRAGVGRVTRIAVLPLRDVSESGNFGYMAEALTDGLISTLGYGTGLRVTSGTTSMQYRDARQPAREIAGALAVDALVEGSVGVESEPSGLQRVRLNLRVIEASTDASIFSRTFVRPRGDLDALEHDVVLAIAGALQVELPAGRASRLARITVTSQEAEQAYLEARAALAQYGVGPALRAVEAFMRAVTLDPQHASAHAGLSRAYVTAGLFGGMLHQDARARGLAAARRALALDDESAEGHAALATIEFFYDWDWPSSERSYQRSLVLNPSFTYARSYYAQFLASQRRFDEALAHATDALALDPSSRLAQVTPPVIAYYKRDYAGAETTLRSLANHDIMLGRVLEATGRIDEALDATMRASETPGSAGVPVRVQILRLQALAGRRDEALEGLRALEAAARQGAGNLTSRDLGYIYLALARHADAIAAFDRALQERDPTLVWFSVDPRLDPIRTDPRFQRILGAMELRQQ